MKNHCFSSKKSRQVNDFHIKLMKFSEISRADLDVVAGEVRLAREADVALGRGLGDGVRRDLPP